MNYDAIPNQICRSHHKPSEVRQDLRNVVNSRVPADIPVSTKRITRLSFGRSGAIEIRIAGKGETALSKEEINIAVEYAITC